MISNVGVPPVQEMVTSPLLLPQLASLALALTTGGVPSEQVGGATMSTSSKQFAGSLVSENVIVKSPPLIRKGPKLTVDPKVPDSLLGSFADQFVPPFTPSTKASKVKVSSDGSQGVPLSSQRILLIVTVTAHGSAEQSKSSAAVPPQDKSKPVASAL